jgi:hypothetical protein
VPPAPIFNSNIDEMSRDFRPEGECRRRLSQTNKIGGMRIHSHALLTRAIRLIRPTIPNSNELTLQRIALIIDLF